MQVPQGRFSLERLPVPKDPSLRAWDASDEYVLSHVSETATPPGPVLVVNDAFGALACALRREHEVTSWGDSEIARRAMVANARENGLMAADFVPSTDDPVGPFGTVIVKVPRSLALLEDQLRRLRGCLAEGAVVVGAGMTKQIHNSTSAIFEAALGPTTTSLAQRKARLIHPVVDTDLVVGASPFPSSWQHDAITVVNHANVFSRERLDRGTAVLIGFLPDINGGDVVVDLGCGNGVLGAVAASKGAQVVLVDESFQAVASAAATVASINPSRPATTLISDAGDLLPDASADVILCNPPFHAQGARGDDTAWHMVTNARRALVEGGRFSIVGNRQLDHHIKLKRVFGNSRVVGSTDKFVVVEAIR